MGAEMALFDGSGGVVRNPGGAAAISGRPLGMYERSARDDLGSAHVNELHESPAVDFDLCSSRCVLGVVLLSFLVVIFSWVFLVVL